jgi:hypothetical protein
MSLDLFKSSCQLCKECHREVSNKFFYGVNYEEMKRDILACLPKCEKCQQKGKTTDDRVEGIELSNDLELKDRLLDQKFYPNQEIDELRPDHLDYMESGEMNYDQNFRNYDKESEFIENQRRLAALRS